MKFSIPGLLTLFFCYFIDLQLVKAELQEIGGQRSGVSSNLLITSSRRSEVIDLELVRDNKNLQISNILKYYLFDLSNVLVASKKDLKCAGNIENLITLMLKDLPSYANRVIGRSIFNNKGNIYNYVIVAGKPDFEPIPLNNREYTPVFKDSSQQVFFTTLEKQYLDNKAVEIQNYHWLFLTRSPTGWRMVTIFSRLGKPDKDRPPFPLKQSSNSYIGRGIRLWLRDCRAGVFDSRFRSN